MDIVEFLTARYDEDEAVGDPDAVWQLDHDGYGRTLHATANHAKAEAARREPEGGTYWRWDDGKYWFKRDGETIATIERAPVHGADPARVLADIAAKRAIVAEHGNVNDGHCGTCVVGDWGYPTHGGSHPQSWPCKTLRHLAAPYAEHPDYDPTWRI